MPRYSVAPLAILVIGAPLIAAQEGLGYHPPLPSFDINPWEMAPVGGGLPPEPLVYHSNAQKFSPTIANNMYSPLAAAHAYPDASSPWFPYTPPNKLPRALPGPYNQLPILSPEATLGGAYLPHTYVPGALYPQGFGHPTRGYGPALAGSKQPDEQVFNNVPGHGNGASAVGPDPDQTAPASDTTAPSNSLLEISHSAFSAHRGPSAYSVKRRAVAAGLAAHARAMDKLRSAQKA